MNRSHQIRSKLRKARQHARLPISSFDLVDTGLSLKEPALDAEIVVCDPEDRKVASTISMSNGYLPCIRCGQSRKSFPAYCEKCFRGFIQAGITLYQNSKKPNHEDVQTLVHRFYGSKKPNTRVAYKLDLECFADFFKTVSINSHEYFFGRALGLFLLQEAHVANGIVLDFINWLADKKYSSATVARKISTLKSFTKLARMLGLIEWNLEVEAPHVDPYRDTRGPSTDQVAKIFASFGKGKKAIRDRALILLTIGRGLRRDEVCQLNISDYDRDNQAIFVHGKRNKNLWLKLPSRVLEALDAWMGIREYKTLDDPIFCSLDHESFGHRLTGHGIYYIVKTLGDKSGFRLRPHGLRHAAITIGLDRSGGNVRNVQKFSRHADPATVMIYDDNRQDVGSQIAEAVVDEILSDG